ncbi:MAG: patatin-like phospholipase family protein [Crocosphaera sp.]|nr:patatin-like phospholipase family protein [Crocosphaera sp.]
MTFKILSLDGGGIRGVISAQILIEIEKQIKEKRNQSLAEYFDLIAGTSTGSILAAGIALGYTASELLNIYRNEGKRIFHQRSRPSTWLKEILPKKIKKYFPQVQPYQFEESKYSNKGLVETLKKQEKFKNPNGSYIKLKEVGQKNNRGDKPKPILLIPAYDVTYCNTTYFCNDDPNGEHWYNDLPVWQICVSSASAPTFFPIYKIEWTDERTTPSEPWQFPHVDGGVTANNPSLCAIGKALSLGKSLDDISLLSIGTGKTGKPLQFKVDGNLGLKDWATKIPSVFMDGQAQLQSQICEQLMGGLESDKYLRLQFPLKKIWGKAKNIYAEAPLLSEKEQVNQWTQQSVSEEMDDASLENIEQLIKITKKYIGQGYSTENRFFCGYQVKEAIRHFIDEEQQLPISKKY